MDFTGWYSLDIETHDQRLDEKGKAIVDWRTDRLTGVAITGTGGASTYNPYAHAPSEVPNVGLDCMRRLILDLTSRARCIVSHNAVYDWKVLERELGIDIPWDKILDTMLLARVLSKGVPIWRNGKPAMGLGLKENIKHRYNHDMPTFSDTVGVLVSGPAESEIELKVVLERRRVIDERKNNGRIKVEWTKTCQEALGKYERMLRKDQVVRQRQMNELTYEEAAPYAMSDTEWTLRWGIDLWKEASEEERKYYHRVEKWCPGVAGRMTQNGMRIDGEYLLPLRDNAQKVLEETSDKWRALTGTEIRSAKQCRDYLYGGPWPASKYTPRVVNKKLPKERWNLSVGKPACKWALDNFPKGSFAHDLALLKLRHSEVQKIVTTYSTSLLADVAEDTGRLHPKINIVGTESGRWAAARVHQIPRPSGVLPVRKAFVADPGWKFVAWDYTGFEIVLAAHFSQCPVLLHIVRSGQSQHDVTAAAIGCDRHSAKCIDSRSIICTRDGLKRIGDICTVPGFSPTAIHTELFDGKRFVGVADTYVDPATDGLLVVTKRGAFVCSVNHRIVTGRGLVSAKDLVNGDIVPVCDLPYTPENDLVPLSPVRHYRVTNDFAYLIGLYLGDGCGGNSVSICSGYGTDAYTKWADSICKAISSCGFIPCLSVRTRYPGTEYEGKIAHISITNGHEYGVFQDFESLGLARRRSGPGRRHILKVLELPLWVFSLPKEAKLNLLAGLIDTDGTVGKKGSISITTKSYRLLCDLHLLCHSIGLQCTSEPMYNKTYSRWYFRFWFSKKHNELFRGYLRCAWKRDRLENMKAPGRCPENYVVQVLPVNDIRLCDFSVDTSEHLYWFDGIVGHNTLNLASQYGAGANKIAVTMGKKLVEKRIRDKKTGEMIDILCAPPEVQEMVRSWKETYRVLLDWKESIVRFARTNGYSKTMFGRRRYFPDINHKIDGIKWAAERQAVNHVIQGTGSDIIKIAMTQLHKDWKDREDVKLLLQVHDELDAEVREDVVDEVIAHGKRVMESCVQLSVPLKVDAKFGNNWAGCK